MWWFLSLSFWLVAIMSLGAGLLWPWVKQQSSQQGVRRAWFAPWWQCWLQLCTPFLSWRYRWYLQQLLSHTFESNYQVDVFFARQCLLFGGVWLLGAAWVISARAELSLLVGITVLAGLVSLWPLLRLKQLQRHLKKQMQRDFPFMLELLCLSVESGHGLQHALWLCSTELQAGPLQQQLIKIQESMRAGLTREQALEQFAQQTDLDEARSFVAAVQQSIELGGRLAPLLRQQAQQRRQERFLRAEKQALEAPVKMLAPLVLCIFPCTFLVIAYPLFFHVYWVGMCLHIAHRVCILRAVKLCMALVYRSLWRCVL